MAHVFSEEVGGFYNNQYIKVFVGPDRTNRDAMCDWINERCTGKCNLYYKYFCFEKEEDAIMFKLSWG